MRESHCRGRGLVLLAVAGCLVAACARQGLPPGGPRDEIPPVVVSTSPDSGAVRVPLDAPLEIEFSEGMRKGSVIDWVLLSPPRDFGQRSWRRHRFRLSGGDDFQPDVTYTVIVGTGCKDARQGNAMSAPRVFTFATGDSIDQGRIDGRLVPKGQSAHGTIVWALDLERMAAQPDTILPDYIAQAAADSTFLFLGIRPDRRYVLAAHFDANRDREFDRDTEFLAFYPETLVVAMTAPTITGIEIDFRDPEAPGSIAGTVIDSTAAARAEALAVAAPAAVTAAVDTVGAAEAVADSVVAGADSAIAGVDSVGLADSAAADSLQTVPAVIDTPRSFVVRAWPLIDLDGVVKIDSTLVKSTETDTLGIFELRHLDPGFWRLQAALDRNRNRRYDAGEPVSETADSVRVLPLEKTADQNLTVRED